MSSLLKAARSNIIFHLPRISRVPVPSNHIPRPAQLIQLQPPSQLITPTMPPKRKRPSPPKETFETNPDSNPQILDGQAALRASPDADEPGESLAIEKVAAGYAVEAGVGAGVKLEEDVGGEQPQGKANANGNGKTMEGVNGEVPPPPAKKPRKSRAKGNNSTATVVKSEPGVEGEAMMTDPEDGNLTADTMDTSATTPTTPDVKPKTGRKTPTKSSIAAKKASDEIKAFKAEQALLKAQTKTNGSDVKVKKETNNVGGEGEGIRADPDGDDNVEEEPDAQKREAGRPPAVNSDYLPLPWKGRLGYACLNTYLRYSNPPVFSSRTCRIASILEHRHPLTDPSQPEHATKNRPNKLLPASIALGQQYVQDIGLANARDIVKMLKWNEKYGIRFLRLSSEMFPFASHEEYGYELVGFAKEVLGEAGKVAGELGHRLTTHPGQFTQLGSPRQAVIDNAVRDLVYHDELLTLLNLPEQLNRDAVMILHLGGVFGDKEATIERFKTNYMKLSPSIKNRLVLENDDVSWSVHDLLPICEELNIPMVLDFHHHNIIFDSTQLREGSKDIMDLYPRIKATWDRKGITQKMHYSEPTPQAITGRQRRKHNPRPATLPPCAADMDLMIEAKDKEQAVFELMRTFKLPGYETFSNIIPYERADDNKPLPIKAKKKKTKKQIKAEEEDPSLIKEEEEDPIKPIIPEEDVGMGGPDGRVYWPPTMEEWLRPKKREIKKKDVAGTDDEQERVDKEALANPTPMNLKIRQEAKKRIKDREAAAAAGAGTATDEGEDVKTPVMGRKPKAATTKKNANSKKAKVAAAPSVEMTDDEDDALTEIEESDDQDVMMDSGSDDDDDKETVLKKGKGTPKTPPARQSARRATLKKKDYAEGLGEEDDEEDEKM